MKWYRQFLFGLASIISPLLWSQEGSLNGSLQDQNKETIPYATVAIMKVQDSTIVTGGTTNETGNFSMKSPKDGEYFLRFSAIGFKPTFSEPFIVKGENYGHSFGMVTMAEEVTMLNEVMVKSWRPRVEFNAGNMVVSVEGTALAAGSSAFEILSRSPGVSLDQEGNFLLNGKSGVTVMIDGRRSYLSSKELQTMLEGMSAENIKNIEVINNPTAKYDAEGTAGILNINLKSNSLSGLNGSIYAGYEIREKHWYNAGLALNYKKVKWNSFLNLDMAKEGTIRDQEFDRVIQAEGENAIFRQEGKDTRVKYIPSLRVGSDYSINPKHSVGVMLNFTNQIRDNIWHTWGTLQNINVGETTQIDAKNFLDESFENTGINVHYQGVLDSVGTSLSVDLDYVKLRKDGNSKFVNNYSYNDGSHFKEVLYSDNLSDFDIYSAKTDLSVPFTKTSNLDLGVKVSKVISDSKLRFSIDEGGSLQPDPSRSNDFRYEEDIFAGYLSYRNRINDTWNFQLGLRAEQTFSEGRSIEGDALIDRGYLEFFPNVNIEQTLSENYKLNYSFSRRISRPAYKQLNPFIFYLDPYTYIDGNPGLKPQFMNSFQLSQTFLKKYNLLLSYDHSRDYIGEIPLQNPETKEMIFSIQNMNDFRSYGATLVAPFKILPDWHMNNNFVLVKQEYDIVIGEQELENDQLYFTARSTQRINLPLNLKLELFASYEGPVAYGLYKFEDQWWLDAGLKRSFWNDKLDLTFKATDIFKTMRSRATTTFNNNSTKINQYWGNRGVSLNLRYKISNGQSESASRSKSLEELQRAGG
ncbi:TonB-dependent receptor domain-containing protein [Salinimicrobium gaetbulicola]|uniref:TonB-dependent receptor domain-containing protein n=1 Tax=Salinimicrobium gaetbulicola TaxID=999702 RepID=A0ABW3IIE0_9FLAO